MIHSIIHNKCAAIRFLLILVLIHAVSGCQAGHFPPRMTVISPSQTYGGATIIRLGGEVVQPGDYAIFLPEPFTPTDRTAAQELQLHLRLITGHDLAILPESQRGNKHGFFIGRCKTYPLSSSEWDGLGVDGLVIRTHGHDVQLAGAQRGILYAVSVFLEDYLGCRWFAADCMRVPTSGTIVLGAIDHRYVPPLQNRVLDYPEQSDPTFAMRNRLMNHSTPRDLSHGGSIRYHNPGVHTFTQLIPPDKYFTQHPEYFSLVDGKRTATTAQLCLTNPDLLAIAKETVREWIKSDPEAQIISVSQNDNDRYCQCDKCTALARQEDSQAGPVLDFVNAIAADIARDYPHLIIDTLAYRYTRKPPLHIRPVENVTVRLCSIECCFSHPLDRCPENRSFMEDLRGWSRISKRQSIWDYVIPFYHPLAPWPNLYVLQPNIKTFIENGATSIYEEGNYFSRGGEMASLRSYIMAKTLWDPDYDTDRAIDEFLPAYYGPAAPYLRQYIDLLHRPFRNGRGAHMHCGLSPATNPIYDLEEGFLPKAHALFAQARTAVRDDPVRLRRVRLAHLGAIYLTLFERPVYERQGDRLIWNAAPPAGVDAWREFWDVVAIEKITHSQEGVPIKMINDTHILDGIRNPIVLPRSPSLPDSLTIYRLRNRDIDVECIPGFGGRIHSLVNRRSGRDWLTRNQSGGYNLLDQAGSELYSAESWRSPGWNTPFRVIQSSKTRIVMQARLENGLELEREISLASGLKIRCRDSVRNASDQPCEAALRIHPVFDMMHPASMHMIVRNAAGKDHPVNLPNPTDASQTTANRRFRGEERPAGQWGIIDDASGEYLTHRVIAGDVAEYFVDVDYAARRLTLEIWSPTRILAPGEDITFEHEYDLAVPDHQPGLSSG